MKEQKLPLKNVAKKKPLQNLKRTYIRNIDIVKHFEPKVIHCNGNNLQNLPEINADIDNRCRLKTVKNITSITRKNLINKTKNQSLNKLPTNETKVAKVESKHVTSVTVQKPKTYTQIISPLRSRSFQDDKNILWSGSQPSTVASGRLKSKSFEFEKYAIYTTSRNSSKSSLSSEKQKAVKSKSFPSTNKIRQRIEQHRNKNLISSSDSEQNENYLSNLKKEIKTHLFATKKIDHSVIDPDVTKFRQQRIEELRDELKVLLNSKLNFKQGVVADLKSEIADYRRAGGELVYNVTNSVTQVENEIKSVTDLEQNKCNPCKCTDIESQVRLDIRTTEETQEEINPDGKDVQDSVEQSPQPCSVEDKREYMTQLLINKISQSRVLDFINIVIYSITIVTILLLR